VPEGVRLALSLFVLFAALGTLFECLIGAVWSLMGRCPYVYPGSPLVYTSWRVAPLWGLGGLQGVALYEAVRRRRLRMLAYWAALWVPILLWMAVASF